MEHYSFYNINKFFILIIDQTIISHLDKFINYEDTFPAMMNTAEELLDEVRNKILGDRQIELDENELVEIIFDRIYKFRGHETPFSLTDAVDFDIDIHDIDSEDYDSDYSSDSDSDYEYLTFNL